MAQLSSAAINDLPDSAFAFIESGGKKDSSGRTVPRSLRHFPIHDAAHVRNALARIAQGAEFGDKALPKVRAAAKKFGVEVSESASRAEDLTLPWSGVITRSFALDDVDIRSGKAICETCGRDATGRIVDAYAAIFEEPTEVHDNLGHYIEDIHRAAFNRTIEQIQRSAAGFRSVQVFYNHGQTVHGSPSERHSTPLGHPSTIHADGRGLLTSTHYGSNGEWILRGIQDGDILGNSFTGRIIRSDPDRMPRMSRGGDLPRVRRLELGLTEYGPTPLPYYVGATTVAVRATSPDQHSEDGPADTAPPPQPSEPGAEDSHIGALRSASEIRRQIRRFQVLRGIHDDRSTA